MANALYDKGRQSFLEGTSAWLTNKLALLLVDSADYTVDLVNHEFLSSIVTAGRVARVDIPAAGRTSAGGVADASDVTFSAVTGDPSEYLILVRSAAGTADADLADTAQRLLLFIDTATGLPVTPNGGNIAVAFDNGANRIFKL